MHRKITELSKAFAWLCSKSYDPFNFRGPTSATDWRILIESLDQSLEDTSRNFSITRVTGAYQSRRIYYDTELKALLAGVESKTQQTLSQALEAERNILVTPPNVATTIPSKQNYFSITAEGTDAKENTDITLAQTIVPRIRDNPKVSLWPAVATKPTKDYEELIRNLCTEKLDAKLVGGGSDRRFLTAKKFKKAIRLNDDEGEDEELSDN